MKKYLLILFLITLFIIINCSCSMFNNDDLGNIPLDIPNHVLYGMLHTNGADYITVIDMEKDSIIGYYRVTKEGECIGDFCLGSDNFLYLTIDPLLSSSNEVRIFDPKKGKIVGEITTEYYPQTIFLLPENKAFIFHYFVKAGDSAVTNSVIDLTNKTVIKKIISYLGGTGFQEMFT
ncbi:hypothetical protein KAU15_07415, partial [candidate division WOR-3 bacterium]|nr:hypothetical protein [candidate division WOR-3 bacterium]